MSRVGLSLIVAFGISCVSASAQARSGTFVVLSDIHAYAEVDVGPGAAPVATCPSSRVSTCPTCDAQAQDTEAPLFESFLQDVACTPESKGADFVIYSGDWIAHHYMSPGQSALKKGIMTTVTSRLTAQFGSGTLIIPALGNNKEFHRLRIGIGHPGHASRVSAYVLSRPSAQDRERIDASITEAIGALPLLLEGDATKAMTRLHSFSAT